MNPVARNRIAGGLALLTSLSGLFVTGLSETAPEATASAETPPTTQIDTQLENKNEGSVVVADAAPKAMHKNTAKNKGGCLTDESAIADMQRLREELDQKEKEMAKKESELAAKEVAVNEQLQKIEAVRDEIKQASGVSSQKNEEKIAKLVETFETMSPKAAAQVVSNIDEELARESMSRISSQKLAKILSSMDSAKSARLTESLAGVARAKKPTASRTSHSNDVAEATTPVQQAGGVKGGEKNGNLKQSETNVASRQPEPALGREPASSKDR